MAELNWGNANARKRLGQLHGLELVARYLRLHAKLRQPVLVLSFFTLAVILKDPRREIVRAVGHGFLQLPSSPEDWVKALDDIPPLTDIQQMDIINNFCNVKGLVSEVVHRIKGSFWNLLNERNQNTWKFMQAELRRGLNEIERLLATYSGSKVALDRIQDRFISEIVYKNDFTGVISFVERVGDELKLLIPEEVKNESSVDFHAEGNRPWKTLLLDDEPEGLDPLVKALERRGVQCIVTDKCVAAQEKIKMDLRNEIVVVVADYRLFEIRDGIRRHQSKQGYDFLIDLSKTDRFVGLVALSGLSRKFLLESFQKYSAKVAVYSKNDLTGPGAINLFADSILDLGRNIYDAMSSVPKSKYWEPLKQFYIAHRLSRDYEEAERKIGQEAKDFVQRIESIFRTQDPELLSNPSFPRLRDIEAGLKNKTPNNEKHMEIFRRKLVARRIALWLHFVGRIEEQERIAGCLKGKLLKAESPKFLNSELALRLMDSPFEMLVEEKNWLRVDMDADIQNLKEVVSQLFFLVQIALEKFCSGNTDLSKRLSDENFMTDGKVVILSLKDAKNALYMTRGRLINTQEKREYLASLRGIEKVLEAQPKLWGDYLRSFSEFVEKLIKLSERQA
ncbi:hypothetical protein L0156_10340 [bacterium]|nr:hypothetical protein [bacterium]